MPTFAIKNGNDLLTDMTTLLPDNSTQEISPLDHRTVQGQAICSSINKLDNKPLLGVKDYDNTRGITPTLAYEAGELAMQAGVIYQANVDIDAGDPFTIGEWTARGLPGAANGLGVDGGDVILGGTVDRPTTITGIGNTNLLKFESEQLDVQIDKLGFKSVNSNGGFGIGTGVPLVYGIKGDVSSAFNDESRAIWGVATNTDVGIAGYFDSFSNFTKSNALVTDRGNIGFAWTDFPFGATESLINIKNPGGVGYTYLSAAYDNAGTTPVHQLSISGRGDYADGVSIGVIASMGSKTEPLSIASTITEGIGLYDASFALQSSIFLSDFINAKLQSPMRLNTVNSGFWITQDGSSTAFFGNSSRVSFAPETSAAFDDWHFYTEATGNGDRAIYARVASSVAGGTSAGGFFENLGSSSDTCHGVNASSTGAGSTTNVGIEAAASGLAGIQNNVAIKVQAGNGQIELGSLVEYADDTDAGSAGLTTGMLYLETTTRIVKSKS